MKRFHLFIVAALLAVGLSAFTPSTDPVYYYYNGSFSIYTLPDVCPEGGITPCTKPNPNNPFMEDVTLYTLDIFHPDHILRWTP